MFSTGDEGVQVLLHLSEFASGVMDHANGRTRLTDMLERVARGSALNDTLKLSLLNEPGLVDRLFELLTSTAPNVSSTARNHAAKILENMTGSSEAQLAFVSRGLHICMIDMVRSEQTSLYIKKTLATALCNLSAHQDNLVHLARAGIVSALHDEQAESPLLKRKKVMIALQKLGDAISRLSDEELAQLSQSEQQLVAQYAEMEAQTAAQPMHAISSTLIESGIILYLHTAVGGAAWGLFESIRLRQSQAALVQNVVRTCLVTCFVPILLVGGIVSAYARLNKSTDTIDEKFKLYFASCMVLYPAGRLLQIVERFAPLWLGGHIVGFVSFFVYTLYTESDLLKSDHRLLQSK